MRKRIGSTLLALALCLSLLPTAAFATVSEPNPAGTSIFEVTYVDTIDGQGNVQEVTAYYDVVEALANVIQQSTTTKIKLLDDIEFTAEQAANCFRHDNGMTLYAQITGTLVLDLNGHTLDLNTDVEVWNSLTVIDSGEGGTLTAKTLQVGRFLNVGDLQDWKLYTGKLTLSGGTVNCPIDVAFGSLRVSGGEAADTVTVADEEGNGVTVTGGELDELVIESSYGDVSMDISGGTIAALEVPTAVAGDIHGGTFGAIRVTGYNSSQVSAVDFLRAGYAFYDKTGELVNARLTPTVKNVTVKAHTCMFPANAVWCDCGRLAEDAVTAPDDAIAMADHGNYVEYFTDTDDLAGLFSSYNHSSFTLKLLKDVDISEENYAYVNAPVMLDLNGHTLTTDMLYIDSGSLTVMDSDKDGKLVVSNAFRIEMGAGMTLNSGTVERDGGDTCDELGGTLTVNGGKLDYGQGTLYVYTSGGLTVNGGELTFTYYNGANILLKNDAASQTSAAALTDETPDTTLAQDTGDTMRVNGGTVKALIDVVPGTTLTVTGGKIEDAETATSPANETDEDDENGSFPAYLLWHGGVEVNGGSVNISGGQLRKLGVKPGIGGKVALSGGSFDAVYFITAPEDDDTTAADFLADGYAYFDDNGMIVNAYERDADTDAPVAPQDVTVKAHTHNYGTDTTPTACACGSTIKNQPVKYIDAYGKTQYCTDYTVIDDMKYLQYGAGLNAGWYVVKGTVTAGGSLNPNGIILYGDNEDDVHIILCDGAALTVNGGVKAQLEGDEGTDSSLPVSLTIYGQEQGTGTMTVQGKSSLDLNGYHQAGVAVKSLTVNGGTLNIESKYTTGVQVGYSVYATDGVLVNGGALKTSVAAGSTQIPESYGIYVKEGNMTVNKGTVEATSGNASSLSCGIYVGSEQNQSGFYVNGTLTINSGSVTARGGTVASGETNGSFGVMACDLMVNGGTLYAMNGSAHSANGAMLYDLYVLGTITVTGGAVRQTTGTDPDVVLVWNDGDTADTSLTVTGGTLKLAPGSILKAIYMNQGADFGDLLKNGTYGYFDSLSYPSNQLTGANAIDVQMPDGTYLACLMNGNYSSSAPFYVNSGVTASPVPYLDENGDTKTCTVYTELTQAYVEDDDNYTTQNNGKKYLNLNDGWYVVKEDVTVDGTLCFYASNAHLILCNGAELTVEDGLEVHTNLTIYAQPADADPTKNPTGKLTVTDTTDGDDRNNPANYDAIALNAANGSVTINGGVIDLYAYAKKYISVGIDAQDGSMTINGGTVTVHAGKKGDLGTNETTGYKNIGIYANDMTVNGGELTVTTGQISVNDGYAENYGIDIGGHWISADEYEYGTMTVTGGTVTMSTGKTWTSDTTWNFSNGIYLYYSDLTISGGTVTATAGDMATTTGTGMEEAYGNWSYGISSYYADVTVTGGTLTATGGNADMEKTGSFDEYGVGSIGIYLHGGLTVESGGTVIATGKTATLDATGAEVEKANFEAYNYGIYVYANTYYGEHYGVNVNGGTVTATAGSASVTGSHDSESYYSVSAGIGGDAVMLNGGTLTATGGKASAYGETDSVGAYITYLDLYDGTLTVTGDRSADYSYDLCATSATGATENDNPVEMHLYGGKVQSSADGGAVIFYAYRDQDTVVYGGTMKLAKGSRVYTLTTANGVKLTDLLDSGCYYSKEVTAYSGETETVTKTKLTDTDLSRNTLTGSYTWNDNTPVSSVFYAVDADSTSNNGNNGSTGSSSSGGGSSSSGSNPTVSTGTATNPDGSTTKTEVKADGTVIETTKKPDGSTVKSESKTETKKDGTTVETVTETTTSASGEVTKSETTTTTKTDETGKTSTTEVTKTTAPDGSSSTTTTVTDANGSTTTSTVTVSSKAVSEAKKNGESVTLPIDEVKSGSTTTIKVDVPKGGATIEIPVENPTADTVVVIVNKDGTETIISDAKITENGIEITLTEDATIKVIDNSRNFSDVPANAYFANAVKWAAARGITGGVTATTFGPHASCTRAQLVTFLWRAAGQPKAKSTSGMTDVLHGAYYADAVHWAAELGLVGGYGNGLFGVNDTITRQQMAVILYRFAQAMGMDTTQGGMAVREYKDYESISDYAVAAMQWAVNAGILQGNDGYLNPTAPCTRAQIVTMLYRLLGE